MYKLPYKDEDEQSWFEWKKFLNWHVRQGKKIKRKFHKKMRRDAKKVIKEQLEETL
jgi:hypothetical protein